MSPATDNHPRHPDSSRSLWLESLRGAACLAAVLFHADFQSAGPRHPIEQFIAHVTIHGWLGVPVFFALSGYFITGSIERRAGALHGPLAFWRDRFLRIYPVFWAAFIFSGLLALAATPFNGLAASSAWPATSAAWLGDLTLSGVWFGIGPRLLVSWSLAYEIGFYVIVGLSLFLPLAQPLSRLAFFAAFTVVAHFMPYGLFPLLDLWPQFAAGIFAAYALSPRVSRPTRLVATAYPALLFGYSFLSGNAAAATASLIGFLILVLVTHRSRLPAPPAWLLALGAASYSIYLVHIPVMSPLRNFALRHVARESVTYLAVCLGIILAGLAAGFLFHRLVERPCERFRRSLPPI
jgi:peptidoglycan/LPS O-acetylase OafA/YrhL